MSNQKYTAIIQCCCSVFLLLLLTSSGCEKDDLEDQSYISFEKPFWVLLDVEQVPTEEQQAIRLNLESELEQYYTPEFLNKYLTKVYVYSQLKDLFIGSEFDGTLHYSNLFIKAPGNSMHHELAHVYHMKNRSLLNQQAWEDLNTSAISYSSSGVTYVATGGNSYDNLSYDSLRRAGFFRHYSTSSFKEDYAVVCEYIFSKDFQQNAQLIADINSKYPKLKAKINMVREFFEKIGLQEPAYLQQSFGDYK